MEIIIGRVYKHFKGGLSLVLCTAKHSDREEVEVVYKGLNNGKCYARPTTSFLDIVKDGEGKDVPRFTALSEEESMKVLSKEENMAVKQLVKLINSEPKN